MEKKIIYVGIDGTICDSVINNDYEKAKPIVNRIQAINKLYESGHTIFMTSARNVITGKDFTQLTKNQLKKWGVNYHHLSFGKPEYDYLIDDKSISDKNLISFVDDLIGDQSLKKTLPCYNNYWVDIGNTIKRKNTSDSIFFKKKPWANETRFLETPDMCAKIMNFISGMKTPFHFHINRHQTWFVYSGSYMFTCLNKEGEKKEQCLKPGEKIDISTGISHKLECIESGDIFIVSFPESSQQYTDTNDAFTIPETFDNEDNTS
jgi:mannose-6-phosphate isomerase-like protein (cupin superfamily)